tara:strand:- start:226 stop:489 length:264 start_codon:yes stop_codon:yes gene_type:complete
MEDIEINAEYIDSLSQEQIIKMIKKLHNYQKVEKKKNRKYVATEKGKRSTRNASKRYYYRKKCNNRYHEIYNPEGIRPVPIIEIDSE